MAIFRRDVTLALLAVEAYHRTHGHYPQTLDQTVPQFLPKIPRDAFGGGPIGYHLANGKPVLYSLGVDRDDDGGRPYVTEANTIEQTQAMRWRPRGSSSDIVDADWILFPPLRDETLAPDAPLTRRADVPDRTLQPQP
jgi:hypothetical protein